MVGIESRIWVYRELVTLKIDQMRIECLEVEDLEITGCPKTNGGFENQKCVSQSERAEKNWGLFVSEVESRGINGKSGDRCSLKRASKSVGCLDQNSSSLHYKFQVMSKTVLSQGYGSDSVKWKITPACKNTIEESKMFLQKLKVERNR